MISSAQGQTKDKETGEEVGEIPKFGFLVDWFEHHLPKDENTVRPVVRMRALDDRLTIEYLFPSPRLQIAHGDYKIDNIVNHPEISALTSAASLHELMRAPSPHLPIHRFSTRPNLA